MTLVAILLAVMIGLFPLATVLSAAGRLVRPLRAFLRQPVEIRVWGELRGSGQIDSVKAIGAGLHLYVTGTDGEVVHLKVAQPRAAQITESAAEIHEAAYVQWTGRKLPKIAGQPAVAIVIK